MSMQEEYSYFEELFRGKLNVDSFSTIRFFKSYEKIMDENSTTYNYLSRALLDLSRIVYDFFHIRPILLIDEYDQPIMSSYEFGYHDEIGTFFSNLYGEAMEGNLSLGQALLTGVQRVAKESIFSQFINSQVYTVIDTEYAPYFGLNEAETKELLETYGYELNEEIRRMYDGYHMGGIKMYNPWSVICYAKKGRLENYWVKTSANFLVKSALKTADSNFLNTFDQLAAGQGQLVFATLDTSFAKRNSLYCISKHCYFLYQLHSRRRQTDSY